MLIEKLKEIKLVGQSIFFLFLVVSNILVTGVSLELMASRNTLSIIGKIFLIVCMYVTLIIVLVYVCRGQSWWNKSSNLLKTVSYIVSFVLILVIISVVMNKLSGVLVNSDNVTSNQSNINQLLKYNQLKFFMIIQIVFLAPVIEELIFRGVLVKWFLSNSPLQWALSSSLFALIHEQNELFAFTTYFLLGCTLFVARKKLGILGSLLVHIIYNSSLLLLFFLN